MTKLILFLVLLLISLSSIQGQIDPDDEAFLDDLERTAFAFFWEQTGKNTGQVKDRSKADLLEDPFDVSSIAATGYGLTALGIGHFRGYGDPQEIENRVYTTLKFIHDGHVAGHRGFYYHFVHMDTGERMWNSELSSIDTALLINGVLFSRQYWSHNAAIVQMATDIYDRVDYEWMLNGDTVLSMGWHPENGGEFIVDAWDRYCETLMLVLQGVASKTHPIPVTSWTSFRREELTYDGLTYITTVNPSAPLFIHQFSHAWYDFFNKTDAFTDYFENTKKATIAHRRFCLELKKEHPEYPYSENYWGITASDTPYGYTAWGGPPLQGPVDGSVVPCAAAGSIPFLPKETISMLRNLRETYPQIWKRYGFIDAFNPRVDGDNVPPLPWYNSDVIGIDVGVTMLMAENYRSGLVWKWFMKDPDVIKSMKMVGFSKAPYEPTIVNINVNVNNNYINGGGVPKSESSIIIATNLIIFLSLSKLLK